MNTIENKVIMSNFSSISITDEQSFRRSPRLMEQKYPIAKKIEDSSSFIKVKQLREKYHPIFTVMDVIFSIEIPLQNKKPREKYYENPYNISLELQEKIIQYLQGKDIYNLFVSKIWLGAVINVARKHWNFKGNTNRFKITGNSIVIPSAHGIGLSIIQTIWRELVYKERAEKVSLGLEYSCQKIPPTLIIFVCGKHIGMLSYRVVKIFNQDDEDDSLIIYLKKLNNILFHMFN